MSFHGLGRFCAAQDWKAKIPTLVEDLCPRWMSWSSWKEWFGKQRGLEIKRLALPSFQDPENGAGSLHRVFAADGFNFYGRVPQGQE